MTNYYCYERGVRHLQVTNAGSKARDDVDAILESEGFEQIEVVQSVDIEGNVSRFARIKRRLQAVRDWREACKSLRSGDRLVVQLPIRNHSKQVACFLSSLSSIGIEVICLAHDLELLRVTKRGRLAAVKTRAARKEEITLLNGCSRIILHNERMRDQIRLKLGDQLYRKSAALGIFDYLIEDDSMTPTSNVYRTGGIIIAGNLSREKAGYIYHLPTNVQFNLYGSNYDSNPSPNVIYKGSYPAESLPIHLEGGFGLVWDGPSIDTCEGNYGDYLRVNNPHKTSLYLACGIPVIIWKQAALADYITENEAGIAIDRLGDLAKTISELSDEDYSRLLMNARRISTLLRQGAHLRSLVASWEEQ